MDMYRAAQQGGFQFLDEEAMPTVTASTQIFANAPVGTVMVAWTNVGGTLTTRFDGGVVTSTTGLNWGANTTTDPYSLPLTQAAAQKVRAIGASVTSGWITYWGL